MKKLILLASALLAMFSISINAFASELDPQAEPGVIEEKMAYVYIGDSRTVGLNNVCHMSEDEDTFVIAAVGKGYKWWSKDGLNTLLTIEAEHPEYTAYTYIFNLGVNDTKNADKYEEVITYLQGKGTTYVVSVNPVVDSKSPYVKNSRIESLNNTYVQVADNYIDTYSYLVENGFSAPDGIHYSKDTYRTIYALIQNYILQES